MSPLVQGFLLAAGICGTLGPQTMFVLRQGIRGDGAILVAMICTLADVLLIVGAIAGAEIFAAISPSAYVLVTWGSALFVLTYGCFALAAALRSEWSYGPAYVSATSAPVAWPVSAALALSLLNPQVYVEMLLLIGGVSLHFEPADRPAFGLGVALVSPLWFFGLALFGRRCATMFASRRARMLLDLFSGLLMIFIGLAIVVDQSQAM